MLPCAVHTVRETYRKGNARRGRTHCPYHFIQRQSFHYAPLQEIFAMWFRLHCIWLEMTHTTLLLCEYVLSDSVQKLWEENHAKHWIFSQNFFARRGVMHNNKDQIPLLDQQWLKRRSLCQYLPLRLSEIFSPPERLQAFGLNNALAECQPLLQPQWLTLCSLFLLSTAKSPN